MAKIEIHNTLNPTEGELLAKCYRILLGDEYLNMISQLYELNKEKALRMMKDDIAFVFGHRPKKTEEEINAELREFFLDEYSS